MNSFQLEKCRLRSKRVNDVFQGLLSVKKYFKKRRFSWNRLGWRFFGISASIPSKSCPVFCFFLHFLLVLSVSLAFVSYICAEIIIKCHYLNLARAMLSSVRGSVHNNDYNLLPWLKVLAIWARATLVMHFELTTSFNIRHIQFTLWIPSVTRKLYYIIHSDTKISRYSFLKLLCTFTCSTGTRPCGFALKRTLHNSEGGRDDLRGDSVSLYSFHLQHLITFVYW